MEQPHSFIPQVNALRDDSFFEELHGQKVKIFFFKTITLFHSTFLLSYFALILFSLE